MLSGAIWVAKGGLIIFGVVDLGDWLIAAELFFALALVALYLRLGDHRGRSGRLGGLLAYVAVALSAVNAPYSLFFAEDRPQAPFPFNVTIFMASLAIVVGLILLGTATLQAGILPAGWRSLPLVVGALALLPVWVLAFVHLELPIVVLGFAWMLLGYVLWSDAGVSARQRSPLS